MKTKKILLTGILGIALAGVVFTGCKKDSTAADSDFTAAQDDANATSASNDAKSVSDAAMQTNGLHGAFNFNSYYNATITWAKDTLSGAGDTLYIKFPSTPTLCGDYKYREGEIIVYWPYEPGRYLWQAYLDSNVTITELFRGYAVGQAANNMNTISGTRTWTNEGHNVNGYENWNFSANLTLTYSNGQQATWNSNRVNVLTEVGTTWYYSVTGYATGTARNGVGYTLTITSPLYLTAIPWWAGGCAWIESGTINVNRSNNNNTLTVNFGNIGTCDATAVATINGNNYTFSMW
jgi:hypothetical protein